MATYPLLFSFHDVVAGKGFVAGVTMDGRAILVEDEEGAWFYGVEPGSLAGFGSTHQEAHQDFRSGYRSVLADIADEAQDFDQFYELVEEFLTTPNEPNLDDWNEAVQEVRSGAVNLEWLPRRDAEASRRHNIVELEEPSTGAQTDTSAEREESADRQEFPALLPEVDSQSLAA